MTNTTRRALIAGGLGGLIATRAFGQTASEAPLPDGLVGEFHAGGQGRRPAILVLGGSEGGTSTASYGSKLMAAQGYSSLGLAYYKAPGVPSALENIPLEYFFRAIDWLAKQPSVDPRRIGVLGGSKGAEAALLLASRDPRIRAVVASAPSSVVWSGVDGRQPKFGSSWSWKGVPLPYVKYDFTGFKTIRDVYDKSYAAAPPEAVIPVEKINGPVMLISGGKDELWPSTPMADAMIARLDAAHVRHKHVHLSYPDAGHGVFGPPATRDPKLPPAAPDSPWALTQAAKADSWPKALAFLKEALKA